MQLSGNTILITGGGTGIGQALALALAENNQVVICGRRPQPLNETVERDCRIKAYPCDITNADDVETLRRKLQADELHVNMLINNAAILNHYHLGKPEDFDAIQATTELHANLTAPITLTMAMLPQLLNTTNPVIINIGSPGGVVPVSPTPIYSASKAGLHTFTQILRLHLKGKATVVEVFPPTVDTAMTGALNRKKMSTADCLPAILKGLAADAEEVWVGEGRIVRWLMNLLPPGWVFKLVSSQPSMKV